MRETDSTMLTTGSRDRFEIRKLLGAGGMGSVFLARDRARRHDVALKTLSQLDGKSVYRMKQEFRSLANIVHKNLVTLYELLVQDDSWFFTMTHVDGVSFLEYVRPYLNLLPEEVTKLDTGFSLIDINEPIPLSQVLGSKDNQALIEEELADVTYVEDEYKATQRSMELRRNEHIHNI